MGKPPASYKWTDWLKFKTSRKTPTVFEEFVEYVLN